MLSVQDQQCLLDLARRSIKYGLAQLKPLPINTGDYDKPLQAIRACFVTLHSHDQLRGCIGHLEAVAPLVEDVVDNAFAAAFRDPRFSPVTEHELDTLDIHISVLTPGHPVTFDSEADLISKLQPGVDGLILQEGAARGTFLPSVWEALPEPTAFLEQLKRKAGLPVDYWSPTIQIWRYQTESFS